MVQGQDVNFRWGEEALGKGGQRMNGLVEKFDVFEPQHACPPVCSERRQVRFH